MQKGKLGTINTAIVGYGNLGKACEQQIRQRSDEFNLVGAFSRRQQPGTIPLDNIMKYRGLIDVVLFCGGSSNDAPIMVPRLNEDGLSTVDSYDNHGEIPNYLKTLQAATDKSGTTAIVGAGWDPGLLSIQRVLNKAFMPNGVQNTLYGGESGGLSMGHSNAVRGVPGVKMGIQLTFARNDAQQSAHEGQKVAGNERHKRVCYVVSEPGVSKKLIKEQICNMPEYFKGQQTIVNFIDEQEFLQKYSNLFTHGGQIISVDPNAKTNFSIEMKSNPELTATAMLAYTRANREMHSRLMSGAFTIADVPPAWLIKEEDRLGLI